MSECNDTSEGITTNSYISKSSSSRVGVGSFLDFCVD